jgi:hypothetical protein
MSLAMYAAPFDNDLNNDMNEDNVINRKRQTHNRTQKRISKEGFNQQKVNSVKQGWNDPSQTENTRISQALTGTLGGKITFGNGNKPVIINYLGGTEGQSGGIPKPLRNKF